MRIALPGRVPPRPTTASDTTLTQWPLAPPAVILSASLSAYYGHIRASGRHRRVFSYARGYLDGVVKVLVTVEPPDK